MIPRHNLQHSQRNASSPLDSRPLAPAEHALHSRERDYASTPASNVASSPSSPSSPLNPHPPLAAMSPPLPASDAAADLNPIQRYATRAPVWQFNAVAGAIGGFTSGVVTCPLDVIKTKLQAQGGFTHLDMGRHAGHPRIYNGLVGTAKVIWRDEGVGGMYRGLGPIILGYLPTWAVYFSMYQRSKGFFANYTENRHLVNMYSSITAGATSTIVTNPIWVIKTRLMSQSVTTLFPKSANTPTSRPSLEAPWHYRSTWDAARKMYSSEGILSFYSGLTPALLGLTHVAVHIPVYEFLKQQLTGAPLGASPSVENDKHAQNHNNHHQAHGKGAHWFGIFAASIMSKILASSATYPHEVIRTRLQTQRRPMAGEQFLQGLGVTPGGTDQKPQPEKARLKYRGVIQTFRTIMAEEGWRAFYAGMGTNLVRAVPAATVTFLTYEYVMAALNNARRDGQRILQGEI